MPNVLFVIDLALQHDGSVVSIVLSVLQTFARSGVNESVKVSKQSSHKSQQQPQTNFQPLFQIGNNTEQSSFFYSFDLLLLLMLGSNGLLREKIFSMVAEIFIHSLLYEKNFLGTQTTNISTHAHTNMNTANTSMNPPNTNPNTNINEEEEQQRYLNLEILIKQMISMQCVERFSQSILELAIFLLFVPVSSLYSHRAVGMNKQTYEMQQKRIKQKLKTVSKFMLLQLFSCHSNSRSDILALVFTEISALKSSDVVSRAATVELSVRENCEFFLSLFEQICSSHYFSLVDHIPKIQEW
jgi:hypothetical protein